MPRTQQRGLNKTGGRAPRKALAFEAARKVLSATNGVKHPKIETKPLAAWGDRALDVFRWRLLERARDTDGGKDFEQALRDVPVDERDAWRKYAKALKQDGSDDEDEDAEEQVDTFNFNGIRAAAKYDEVSVRYTPLYTTLIRNRLHLKDLSQEKDDATGEPKLLRHPWAQFLAWFQKHYDNPKVHNGERSRILSECMADDDQRLIFSEAESITFIYRNIEEPYVCVREVKIGAVDAASNFFIYASSKAVREAEMEKLKDAARCQSAYQTRCNESAPTGLDEVRAYAASEEGEHPWFAFIAFVDSNAKGLKKLHLRANTLAQDAKVFLSPAKTDRNSLRLVPGDRFTAPFVHLLYVTRRAVDDFYIRHNERYYLYASAPSRRAQQLRRLCARVMELAQIQVVEPPDAADAGADSSSEEEEVDKAAAAAAAPPPADDDDASGEEEEDDKAPAAAPAADAMDTGGGDVSGGEEGEASDEPQPRVESNEFLPGVDPNQMHAEYGGYADSSSSSAPSQVPATPAAFDYASMLPMAGTPSGWFVGTPMHVSGTESDPWGAAGAASGAAPWGYGAPASSSDIITPGTPWGDIAPEEPQAAAAYGGFYGAPFGSGAGAGGGYSGESNPLNVQTPADEYFDSDFIPGNNPYDLP